MSGNDDEIAYWNSSVGDRWVQEQVRLDSAFRGFTTELLSTAAAIAGEKVVDVGCGAGATTLAVAERVGPKGRVLAVDVSHPLLKLAKRRATEEGLTQIELQLADASTHAFQPEFDLVLSRFGVMFFTDPEGAFRNLRRALKPGGRLAFLCWQPMAKNAFFHVPLAPVKALAPPSSPPDPLAPGPFAFSDPSRVQHVLTAAGFSSIVVQPIERSMHIAASGDVDAATDLFTRIGPTARLLADAPPDVRERMQQGMREALAKHDGPHGIELGGAVYLVTAVSPVGTSAAVTGS